MCYEVKCSSCGKTTWCGCGRHVRSVYKRIPQGQHCLCNGWPGVDPNNPNDDAAQKSSSCTIL
ncbi:hypothetical protein JCGZ_15971 [Jatropha curcas]|uniref:Uncharacterized protein n=1 Tax=Jatropha curcas TaxID=180498 RepID=A0A067LBT0_JATCU|nr:hypothetical protein JCGZ_15971 [Jatropha curcas]